MKGGSIVCTLLFVVSILLCLAQMWFEPFDTEIFWKLLITLAAFFAIALGITLVFRDYVSEKEMQKKGFLR